MQTNKQASLSAFDNTKPHYQILDGLRGIAAIVVVLFHISETFIIEQSNHVEYYIGHGYLAVDFFFILSGFVIGYAYDDRLGKTMSTKEFIKRRLIRLQPMVVMGAIIGGLLFYFQGFEGSDVSQVTLIALIVATLLNALLIPTTPGIEIRGFSEMYPLNGPSWSLLFEYIGNLLYVLFIRRLSTTLLSILVTFAALGLASFAIFGASGDLCVGFSLTSTQFSGGFLRLLFSFSAGILLFRVFKQPAKRVRFFWLCAIFLITLLAVPRLGGEQRLWLNGVYESVSIIILFPLIVYMGASGEIKSRYLNRICKFLGDISYPLYVIHYPLFWVYYAWVKNNDLTFTESIPGAAAFFFGSIALAYLCLRLYDTPIRKLLSNRFIEHK